MERTDSVAGAADCYSAKPLEAFSRDLMALVRCVKVYPAGHPFLAGLAERLLSLVGGGLPDPLILGVTPSELILGSEFIGKQHVRCRELAGYLHSRRVLRVVWTGEAQTKDVVGFADVLSSPKTQGTDLRKALHEREIFTIDAEPLTYERIHSSFRPGGYGEERDEQTDSVRGRQAWSWLLDDEVAPEKVAELLTSEQFWDTEGPVDSSAEESGAVALAAVLMKVGRRLGVALDCLPEERRRSVEERLSKLGRDLSPSALAGLLRDADGRSLSDGPVLSALENTLAGERLVDVLANLVSLEGHDTRRMADVYRRFAPGGRAQELLPVVRARLESAERGGLAVEIWSAVEDFLLGLDENPFMAAEYAGSLDSLTEAVGKMPGNGEKNTICVADELEGHLDEVFIGAALSGDGDVWRARLLDRLVERADQLPLPEFLRLLEKVDRELPGLTDSDPEFGEQVYHLGSIRMGGPDAVERKLLSDFIVRHEGVLVNAVLRSLADEERIAARRFLVDVLSRFSSSATPVLVSRMRSAPWYVTRNLTIALGRKGEIVTMPVLRSLLGHDHPKVRREAIIALGRYQDPAARQALQEIAGGSRDAEHQQLAERVLRDGGSSGVSL